MAPLTIIPDRPCRPEPTLIAMAKAVPVPRVEATARRKAALLAELFGIVPTPEHLLVENPS